MALVPISITKNRAKERGKYNMLVGEAKNNKLARTHTHTHTFAVIGQENHGEKRS